MNAFVARRIADRSGARDEVDNVVRETLDLGAHVRALGWTIPAPHVLVIARVGDRTRCSGGSASRGDLGGWRVRRVEPSSGARPRSWRHRGYRC